MAFSVATRWQASGIHLLISIGVAAAALTVMLGLWYPGPLFEAAGGNELLKLLVSVDVIIGPLLTLAVYKRGKPGMKFDLVVIGMLQLAALAYGAHVVFLARPAFIVFVKDRFEVATAVEIEPEEYAKARDPQFSRPSLGAPKLVYAVEPTDQKERNELVNQALAGRDMQHFPKLWEPYERHTKEVLAKAWTLDRVRTSEPGYAAVIDEWMKKEGKKDADVRYVLLRARRAWVAVLLDPATAEPVKMLIVEKI